MKHKIILVLLVTLTVCLSHIVTLYGTWEPLNPPLWARLFVVTMQFMVLSAFTIVPYLVFRRR